MAGYGRFPRNYSPCDGYGEWTTEPIHNPELMCRSSVVEGRRRPPTVVYGHECNPQTYVIENTVEQVRPTIVPAEYYIQRTPSIHPSAVPEYYKQNTPSMLERRGNYGEVVDNRPRKPLGPSIDGPPEVEEFLGNIQTAVSQPPRSSIPMEPCRVRIPVSTGYPGPTSKTEFFSNVHTGGSQPPRSSIPREPYPVRIAVSAGYPVPTSNTEASTWGKPGRTTMWSSTTTAPSPYHGRPEKVDMPAELPRMAIPGRRQETSGHNTGLSKPITDIDEAMKYLQEVAKPASDGNEFPKPPVTSEASHGGKPDHTTTWSSTATVPTPYNVQHKKADEPVNPQHMAMPLPGRRREASGQDMGLPPPRSTSETIDSKEARRRYGNLKPVRESSGGGNIPTISSREAAKKYNGTLL